jgi:ssDNA-binding Zn-finger/Zn-ribbon topoisomerase 1
MGMIEDISLDDAPVPTKPGERFDLRCPDCGDFLRLREPPGRLFYGCRSWPVCHGAHAANPDGSPTGTPANAETRRWRVLAHETFDRLWRGPKARMSERQAYLWIDRKLGFKPGEGRIARLTLEQCQRLISLAKEEYPELRSGWDRLLGRDSF